MSCKVFGCRHAETHVSLGHQCGVCKAFGHGQQECYSLTQILPQEKWCTVRGCQKRKLHTVEAHVCPDCNTRGERCSCQVISAKCPICRKENFYKPEETKVFGIEQKCIVCGEKEIDTILPDCRHSCLCNSCLSRIQTTSASTVSSEEEKEAISSAIRRFGDRDMVYVKEYAGQGCMWFIKKVRGTVSTFFLHGDNQGQYGEDTNDVPLAMAFVAGCTEL